MSRKREDEINFDSIDIHARPSIIHVENLHDASLITPQEITALIKRLKAAE